MVLGIAAAQVKTVAAINSKRYSVWEEKQLITHTITEVAVTDEAA